MPGTVPGTLEHVHTLTVLGQGRLNYAQNNHFRKQLGINCGRHKVLQESRGRPWCEGLHWKQCLSEICCRIHSLGAFSRLHSWCRLLHLVFLTYLCLVSYLLSHELEIQTLKCLVELWAYKYMTESTSGSPEEFTLRIFPTSFVTLILYFQLML